MRSILKWGGILGGGLFAVLFVIALSLLLGGLFWGLVAYLVWNTAGLYHEFHGAGTITYFWQAVGVGVLISLVLGALRGNPSRA